MTSPMRTSAVSGTAPLRPCLGKRWISTLTYLRLETLCLIFFLPCVKVLGLKAPLARGTCNACIFSCIFQGVVLVEVVWNLVKLFGKETFLPFPQC